ncbi:kynureninase isoform X2 [Eurytemora carolleeae]|uniref:kynureninase isoform X1 n=2 Tax=Eurytemora carolleeae TaxID=1294199 RepID=UPI000C77C519|nr:kynureninase isoform X1 [Eurytemora carolleeae]XP_023325488.1 kynureninase isoform X2 [Eurytemora carolleeae]|eukprot:XP_023325487.1 kynureninase-like isoform X1 [Eurytemora affinis]
MSTPKAALEKIGAPLGVSIDSLDFAELMDKQDVLAETRKLFVIPKLGTIPCETIGDPEQDCVYLLGNSLGLKPRKADKYMAEQLDAWGNKGIFMHTSGRVPAAYADDQPAKHIIASIVGAADESEVGIMNGLTVNLHLLMLAFYKPQGTRNKIIIEDHAFPSDRYAVKSLMRVLGVSEDQLIMLRPREGEYILQTQDILKVIEVEKDNLALIMLPGVQYYTGQKLDMEAITRVAVDLDIRIGWDLAHAVGNIQLKMHEWGADFAVWCSYKYLNSGAGGISGVFFHNKHHNNPPSHLQGWWSNKQETRFEMREIIDASVGAETFRLCNPPPWLAALHLASLEIFKEVGMKKILEKQFLLTGYLEHLLTLKFSDKLEILTPKNPAERGCQLSLVFRTKVEKVFARLQEKGVICDLRGQVMRVAPVPLYNTYKDVYMFTRILGETLSAQNVL